MQRENTYTVFSCNLLHIFRTFFHKNISWGLLLFRYRDGICPLFGTHNTTFYADKFADRQIRQLVVACENKENGCTWTDTLGSYEVKNNYQLIFFD